MKLSFALTLAILAMSHNASGQSLTINGTSYAGYFGSGSSSVTVTPPPIPDGSLLSVTLGGTANGNLGTYWSATATGGAVLGSNPADIPNIAVLPEVRVLASGAQVALTGSALQFNISNGLSSALLGNLAGATVGLGWAATSTFGTNQLILAPNTTYQVTFDLATGSGLLNSTLGILPTFGVSLLDGSAAVGTAGSGTVANVLGLSLANVVGSPGTGRATVQFTTGNTVTGQAAGLRFTGSAAIPATVVGLGTNFATVSNVTVTTVPEASTFGLAILGGACALRRRRR